MKSPPPGSREAIAVALQNVAAAVIGAITQGATNAEINGAIASGERIGRRVVQAVKP